MATFQRYARLNIFFVCTTQLQWRHNERDGVSNHRRLDCLLHYLFRRRSKKTSKLRGIGLCEGNPLVTGEFPAQRVSNANNVSIWLRHLVDITYVALIFEFKRFLFVKTYFPWEVLITISWMWYINPCFTQYISAILKIQCSTQHDNDLCSIWR